MKQNEKENYKFNEIAVITKNLNSYSALFKSIFSKYDIPVFIDEKKDLNQNILIRYILSILEIIIKNYSYESVFNYLKINFIEIDEEDIFKLEKYCIKYGIKNRQFKKDFIYGINEKNKGETEKLFNEWMEKAIALSIKSSNKAFSKGIYQIVEDFEKIEWDTSIEKPKVGIVGEILIKYHPFGNNYVANLLEKEGAEVILPDFMGFIKFMASNKVISNKMLKNDNKKALLNGIAIKLIDLFEKDTRKALANSKKGYLPTCDIWHLADNVKSVLSTGNQTGEGWFLTAEMLEYMENGIQNIVCVQPFACLPNHVVGKGVIKTIRDMYPEANIVPVDYDPGASEANQTNRIKLLMTVAKDNLKIKQKEKKALQNENVDTTKIKEKVERKS